jgi:hypothetical protein
MAAIRSLMVRAGADFSPLQREMTRTQSQMQSFGRQTQQSMTRLSSGINTMSGGVQSAVMGISEALAPETLGLSLVVAALASVATAGVSSAMDLETSMTQIRNTLGQSSRDFESWANTVGASFGFSEKSAMEGGAVYSNILSGFIDGADNTKNATIQLMQATAVISSRTGRTMDDVIERIRSGLLGNTESIEDLGVNVNIAMIESTEAFKKLANGKHWNQLDYKTQSQIRLMAILEQSNKKYGQTLADTTQTAKNRLGAEWSNMMTEMGNMFLPVITPILKGLTYIIHYVTIAFNLISRFTKALFGYKEPPFAKKEDTSNINKQTGAVNGLTNAIKGVGKAKKEASSNGVAGFDEVNTLNQSSGSGSADPVVSGGKGLFDDIGKSADDNKTKVDGFSQKVKELGQGMSDIGKGIHDIFTGNFSKGWDEIAKGISEIWTVLYGKEAGKYMWDGLQDIKKGISDIVAGNFYTGLHTVGQGLQEISQAVFGAKAGKYIWEAVKLLGDGILAMTTGNFSPLLNDLGSKFSSLGTSLFKNEKSKYMWDAITSIAGGLSSMATGNFPKGLTDIAGGFKAIFDKVFAKSGKNDLWSGIGFLKKPISDLANGKFDKGLNDIATGFKGISDKVFTSKGGKFLWESIKACYDAVYGLGTGNWSKGLNDIAKGFKAIFDAAGDKTVVGALKSTWNWIADHLNKFLDAINKPLQIIDSKFLPGDAIPDLSKYHVPKLKKGGITSGPTLAMIGDNRGGQEVVSPLDKLTGLVSTAVIQAIQAVQPNNRQQSGDIVLQIDGREFARINKKYSDQESKRVGTNIRLQTI